MDEIIIYLANGILILFLGFIFLALSAMLAMLSITLWQAIKELIK